jgi:hypothetical protein
MKGEAGYGCDSCGDGSSHRQFSPGVRGHDSASLVSGLALSPERSPDAGQDQPPAYLQIASAILIPSSAAQRSTSARSLALGSRLHFPRT